MKQKIHWNMSQSFKRLVSVIYNFIYCESTFFCIKKLQNAEIKLSSQEIKLTLLNDRFVLFFPMNSSDICNKTFTEPSDLCFIARQLLMKIDFVRSP